MLALLKPSSGTDEQLVKTYQCHRQAIQICRKAVKDDPTNFWLWNNLAKLQAITDLDSAIQTCQEGFHNHKCLAPLMVAMNLHASKGDYLTAISSTQTAFKKKFLKALDQALRPGKSKINGDFNLPSDEEECSLKTLRVSFPRSDV